MYVNKVILYGRVGNDIELRKLTDGTPVATCSLVTNEFWVNKNGEKQERAEWHNLVFWNKTAENANNLIKKGTELYVEGKIRSREFDNVNGNKRKRVEIIVESFKINKSKSAATKQENN